MTHACSMNDKMLEACFEACDCCTKQSGVPLSICFLQCIEQQCPQHSREHLCCSGDVAEHQHAASPLSIKCCWSALSVLLQEISAMQRELNSSQQEVRKTQQLFRQLERQLAKFHKSRKDAALASQQMQVSISPECQQWCTSLHLCHAILTALWRSAVLAAQHGACHDI